MHAYACSLRFAQVLTGCGGGPGETAGTAVDSRHYTEAGQRASWG